MKNISHGTTGISKQLRKIAALVASVLLLALVLMFSMVVIAVILVTGMIVWAFLWWKTRELRKQMREFQKRGAERENGVFEGEKGSVIEGEAVRVADSTGGR